MNRARLTAACGIAVLVCQLLYFDSRICASPVRSDANVASRLNDRLLAQVAEVNSIATTAAESPAELPGGDVDASAAVAKETGFSRRETLLASLTIFLLAVFLGFELITKVPPTLHTPLMSGSNAISGITLVGALFAAGMTRSGWLIPALGFLAVVMATVNAVGGFAVTHRMLSMFRRN